MIVSQSEFARLHNVSREAVNDWIKRGVITPTPEGLVDADQARAAIDLIYDPARAQKIVDASPRHTFSFAQEKTLLTRAQRIDAELDLDIKRGALIDAALVEKALTHREAAFKSRMLAIPFRPLYESVRDTLRADIMAALTELSNDDPARFIDAS